MLAGAHRQKHNSIWEILPNTTDQKRLAVVAILHFIITPPAKTTSAEHSLSPVVQSVLKPARSLRAGCLR